MDCAGGSEAPGVSQARRVSPSLWPPSANFRGQLCLFVELLRKSARAWAPGVRWEGDHSLHLCRLRAGKRRGWSLGWGSTGVGQREG